jgi:nitrogen fixation NifU-like protein
MPYSKKVIDHYENPRNVGAFNKDDLNVGTGIIGSPSCGDVLKLQIKVNRDTEIIEDVLFKTFGCGSAIASSSFLTEIIKGRHIDDALTVKNTEIAAELQLPQVKNHCSVLAEEALSAAVKDYKSKQLSKISELS